MPVNSEKFALKVKSVRTRLNLTQDELAQKLGVSFATVNRWENNKTIPSKLAQTSFNNYCAKMLEQETLTHDEN